MSCSTVPEPAAAATQEKKEETLMPRKTIDSFMCTRCKENRGVLVVIHTSYCSNCLEYLLRSRFARAVAPHLPTLHYNARPAGKASFLLASSGGSASAAMVDLFREMMCQSEDAGPKGRHRWNRVVVGWVDFGEEDAERRDAREAAMRRSADTHGFEFWRVSVDEAFDDSGALLDPLAGTAEDSPLVGSVGIGVQPGRVLHTSHLKTPSSRPDSPYRSLLAHLPPTSHPALRTQILHSLLTRMAASLDPPPAASSSSSSAASSLPPYLLLGPTTTRIASLTISALASGRGYALPLLVAPFLDYRGVKLVRPLTAVGKKEMVWYARMRGLETVDWDWESGAKSGGSGRATSIEALTQDFVQTLNSTHPSTVSTISRTSHKLLFPGFITAGGKAVPEKAKKDLWASSHICPLCELPSDEAPLDWLARTSITSLPDSSSSAPIPEPSANPIPLEPQLCYACLTTLVSPSAFSGSRQPVDGADEAHVVLPAWTLPNLAQETVKARRGANAVGGPAAAAAPLPLRREEVAGWLKEEGWLLSDDDDDDP